MQRPVEIIRSYIFTSTCIDEHFATFVRIEFNTSFALQIAEND